MSDFFSVFYTAKKMYAVDPEDIQTVREWIDKMVLKIECGHSMGYAESNNGAMKRCIVCWSEVYEDKDLKALHTNLWS